MLKIIKKLSLGAISAFAVIGLTGSGTVLAQSGMMQTNLTQMNNSEATGTASVEMVGDKQIRVRINVSGTSPDQPHAQHLHIGGTNMCPTPQADADKDGLITSAEGQPAYGAVKVSLTTEGDVAEGSGLAVDRMPKADASGNLSYDRTFDLPEGVTQADVRKAVVVHHGISELFDDKAKYDGEKKSSLDETLPLEATIPAACGALASTPVGGAGAGFGPSESLTSAASLTVGSISVIAAAALVARRRTES